MSKYISALLVAVFIASIIHAQEKATDTSFKELEKVTVSVNKWEQKQNEVPNKIARVNMQTVRLQNPQTAADMLNLTGSVFIQKSQLGGGSPMIRGFATNRILIVVDGVRMNNAIYRSGNLQNVISIDPLSTQAAEVIFGPGSIIYGSDAIGGVMDFHSLQPEYAQYKKWRTRGNAVARYSSANNERTGHLDFSAGTKRFAYTGSVTYSDFDDLKMGKHNGDASYLRPQYAIRANNKDSMVTNPSPLVQRFTGYQQLNVLQRLRFKASDHLDLQYTFHYSGTGNVPRYDRLIETSGGNLAFAEWYYGPQLWRMHALQATITGTNKLFNSARIIAAYQRYEESRHDRRLNNARIRNQVEQVGAFSFNADFDKQLNRKSELFYGVEYITNSVGSFANRININSSAVESAPTRYPNNSNWNSYGIYGSYKTNVNKFTFTTGLRYNYVTVYAPFDTSVFRFPFTDADIEKGALTGNLGLVLRATEHSQFNFNFATGFRVPNVDDIGKVFESAPGQLMTPNPDLNPEYAYNFDLGYAVNVLNKVNFDVTLFYTLLDNAIVRRPDTFNGQDSVIYEGVKSQVFSLQNAARARVWGVQAGVEVFFNPYLSASVQGNWIEGKETDDLEDVDVPLRHAPPFYGNARLKFNRKKIQADLYAVWNGKISHEDLAPSEQAKTFIYAKDANGNPYCPAWYTLNLKLGYQLNRHLLVTAGWENITNQQYRPYSSGIVAPGINFIGSVRASL
ncbi:MAG TPA: TonB-dependent receptor [Chitinophagaceae bacterium]|nr:TonB-dependent receptor [Chitinophagaceae bacterium]